MEHIPSNIMLKTFFRESLPNWVTETCQEIFRKIIYETKSEDHDKIELEIKLGRLEFKGKYSVFSFVSDTFKIPNSLQNYGENYIQFHSGLLEFQFYTLWYQVEKEYQRSIKNNDNEIKQLVPVTYKEFIYKSGKRRSLEVTNEGFKETVILKSDKKHINIKHSDCDFRVTTCVEQPSVIEAEDKVKTYREKFRTSFSFRCFRLDFTVVNTVMDINFNNFNLNLEEIAINKLGTIPTTTFEVEFEFAKLFNALQQIKYDYLLFEKMLNRYLQNAFCFGKAYKYEYNYCQTGKSLFGNYLINNK